MVQKIKQDISIGKNLKKIRMNAGMTQEDVVTQLQLLGIDMSRNFYAHIEQGRYSIRVSELAGLRKIFDVGYEDFFVGIEVENIENDIDGATKNILK